MCRVCGERNKTQPKENNKGIYKGKNKCAENKLRKRNTERNRSLEL